LGLVTGADRAALFSDALVLEPQEAAQGHLVAEISLSGILKCPLRREKRTINADPFDTSHPSSEFRLFLPMIDEGFPICIRR
jgi:hypothetical protein